MRMKMKKTIIVLFLFLVGLNFVFAAESGLNESNNKSSTTLTLSLDKDKYLVGFSKKNDDLAHEETITLSESIENTMTVKLVDETFYFFYKAITDASVSFKIAVTPLYFNGTEVTDVSKKINYTADITPENNVWNGGNFTNSHLDTSGTSGTTTETTCMLKGSNYTNYYAEGVASVVIKSTENLGEKVPGRYSGTITVTLQSGS